MAKKELLEQETYNQLLAKTEDSNYLQSLSDDELCKFYQKAKDMYLFFDQIQNVTKELCNSIYGGFGTASLRYFNQAVAEDITGEGREHCKMMDKTSNAYFSKMWSKDFAWHEELRDKFPTIMGQVSPKPIFHDITVYADTDSNYLDFGLVFESLDLDPKKINVEEAVNFIVYFIRQKLDPIFDKVLKTTISARNGKSTMIFELESIGGFSIWLAKKKYAIAKVWDNGKYVADKKKIKSTGIELAQNSAPAHVRSIITTFVNTIFVRKGNIDSNTFFGMCKSVKDKLRTCNADELSKTNNIGKYEEYVIDDKESVKVRSKCPAAVRGAAKYNLLVYQNSLQHKYPFLRSGMKGKMYYDAAGNPFTWPADIDWPEDIGPEMSVDIQLEKLIFAPIKRIVSGGLIDGDLNKMGSEKVQKGFAGIVGRLNLNKQ
jgi:DNA polymerase elongation subunit (family B)